MILVTGATGNVGREAIRLLLDEGLRPIVAVTRSPEKADLPAEATVVAGDPSRPETLAAAFQDVEAILLSPGAVGDAAAELLALAAKHGVTRVVVLSAATVHDGTGYPRFAERFKVVEDAAKASGLQWTILRCADFDANALAWAPQIRQGGVVRGAYGSAATSPIHHRDIAEVAVGALRDSEVGSLAGKTYLLTGPQSLTQHEKVRLIGEALGERLTFEEIEPEQVHAAMIAQGLPQDVPDRLLGYLADHVHRPGPTTDTVARLLGRPALGFADWAAQNANGFRN